ncbi:hypothetical protein KGY71_07510, partial [Candidatus Bipolaricaulota bacterium]|nr:hypothetical protein [Candidatus Bipolaricaulota bacterium]
TLEYDYLNKEDLRRYLAFDWYFKQGNTMNFLNVNTINAVSRWEFSGAFSLGISASLKTSTGLDKLVLNLVNEF